LERPQVKPRLPAVLSPDDVRKVLCLLDGTMGDLARLLYGTGLRISEALQLRVKDIDFQKKGSWCVRARGARTASSLCR